MDFLTEKLTWALDLGELKYLKDNNNNNKP